MDALPLSDRALHYGDGLFETIAVIRGKPRLWDSHLARLVRGCERLKIPPPNLNTLYDEVVTVADSDERVVVKVIYSRGSGGRGYRLPDESSPRRIVMRYPWRLLPAGDIRLRFCHTPLSCNPVLAGIKHLNRLEQVMARAEWVVPEIYEGLMCDLNGAVKEGTMSNLFWVKKGRLYTPDLSTCGVAGVMREQLFAVAATQGVTVETAEIAPEELLLVDEIGITNALIGLTPVAWLEDYQLPSNKLLSQLQIALNESLEYSR